MRLSETVVSAKRSRTPTAKQIIRYALERIPDNYDNSPFALTGYYRDYQLKDQEYVNLNEAIIRVFDGGFKNENYHNTEFALYEYSKNHDFIIDSFAAKPYDYSSRDKFIPDANLYGSYMANELVLLFIHDAIRNRGIKAYSFVYSLVEDFLDEHRFLKVKNTTYGNQAVFQIGFKKNAVPFEVRGTIYIDQDDFAIRKLDYTVYKQGQLESDSSFVYSSAKKDLLYEILVEYQGHNEHMYLNYISFHNQFKLIRPPKFFITNAIMDSSKKTIDLILNRPATNWPDLRLKDFTVLYQGKKLKIDGVSQMDPSRYSIRFPKKNPKQQRQLNLLFSKLEDEGKASLQFHLDKMVDSEGNRLGARQSELLNQFREFFTQRVSKDENDIAERARIVKTKSLGDTLQPFVKIGSKKEFWMNTPLRSNN